MDKKILGRVYKYLSLKPRTKKEVKEYILRKFNLPLSEVENIVNYLCKNGFIDDDFVKESYVHSRILKGFGRKYIKHKLMLRGIRVEDNEITLDIDRVVGVVLRRYGKEIAEGDRVKIKAKIHRFLLRRGFSKNEVNLIISKILDNLDNR
ncbi:MAG: RecX family transcriptional regulator [Brevinematia bacterium]